MSGAKDSEVRHAVAWFTPDAGGATVSPPKEPFTIVTVNKSFRPRTMTVPVGSTVRFPNEDSILHNVFSLTSGNRFDLGLFRRGESRETTFEKPGVVRIFCNVHHDMIAYVVVLDTPFHTSPGDDGRFRLSGLPAGSGTLSVWHELAGIWTEKVERLPLAAPLRVRLAANKRRVPVHKNKFGKPYSRRRRY